MNVNIMLPFLLIFGQQYCGWGKYCQTHSGVSVKLRIWHLPINVGGIFTLIIQYYLCNNKNVEECRRILLDDFLIIEISEPRDCSYIM